jgi:lysine 2,3-aminomutase
MNSRRPSLKTAEEIVNSGFARVRDLEEIERVAARYAVSLTPQMAELIEPGADHDPIGRQFVPDIRELEAHAGERPDPIGDVRHQSVPGLIHRYPDRVLLKLVSVCPVYCRFCFRRSMVGPGRGEVLTGGELAAALDYIRADRRVWEVIVSGGDPLILSHRRIGEVTAALANIPHVKVLRWHTRVPVVAPELITAELVGALRSRGQAVYVALHANHPRELTAAARAACARLVEAGIAMVGQTVLLKGVNDDAETLEALMRALVECRVKPYYLHHLDAAPGTGHFRTTIERGRHLMRALRGRVSGLAQPAYVLDIPGGHGKVPIGPDYLSAKAANGSSEQYEVEDIYGRRHSYPETAEGSGPDGG